MVTVFTLLLYQLQGLASEASYLWQIKPPEGKGVVSYLFGSIHVPHAKVFNSLSDEVMEAFKVCGNLIHTD